MIIDCNMHWLPETLFSDEAMLELFMRAVPRNEGVYGDVINIPGSTKKQIVLSKPKGYANLNFSELDTNTELRLKIMEEARIDKAILRIPCWEGWLTLEMAKKLNNLLAQCVKKHPDRFFGLALAPPWGDKESLKEVERCIKEYGCCGVEIATHYGELYLDEEEFRPHLRKINELGVPVVIHHSPLPVEYRSIYKYTNVRRLYGRAFDQLTCLGRILHCGLLEELPNIRLIFSYLAGGFHAFTGMIAVKKSVVKEEMERSDTDAAETIDNYLKRNVYFDMCHAPPWGKDQLEFAIKALGADHVLFGTSYPVKREWCLKGVEFVKNLDIDEKAKSLVLGENAMKLFHIK
jgi:predicted TIM-barrel fold metal-dependent hydrolase